MDNKPKVALQKIIGSLHSAHEILENILDRDFDDKVSGICERLNLDLKDGLKLLAVEAHNIHELAKEIQFKLSGCMEMQKKEEKSRMESMTSSLMKENQDISSILKIAITEKEAAENSLRMLKDERDQRKSTILQIAEKGLQKVGFGFIMEVISAESESEEMSSSSASTTSNGRESKEEVVNLASVVGETMKNLPHEINDLRQALDKSRSDCDHLQLLAAEQAEKINKHESHIKDLEERESFLVHSVEELIVGIKVEQEAARWREACELEVEAGKAAIRELNLEVNLLKEELGRVKADLDVANSKLQLKERLADNAMTAQAAADACLKLADSRAAGLQQMIEELTRQIEQEDAHGRKERESAREKNKIRLLALAAISSHVSILSMIVSTANKDLIS